MYQGKSLLQTGKCTRPLWNLLTGIQLRKHITAFNLEQIPFECCKIKT